MDAPCCARCDAESESEAQSLADTMADGGCSPFDFASQEEVRGRVEAALREVPEVFRAVVVLRELEGFAYEEIAEILQVNLGTVKSRLTRGRAALRELLAPERNYALCPNASGLHRTPAPNCARVADPVSVEINIPINLPINGPRRRTHADSRHAPGAESLAEVSR